MHRLHLLGRVDLLTSQGEELRKVLAQPKRLALLAYLCVAARGRACRRDQLLALFWPELDQHRARKALNKAVFFLRGALGEGVIVSRGVEELAVDRTLVWCDAAAFLDAIDRSHPAEAIELYRGELLPAFHLDDAPAFEEWLERERGDLRRRAVEAARLTADQHRRKGEVSSAVAMARRAVELSDADERAVRQLLELLDELGDRAAALHEYDSFARNLAQEYAAEPAAETQTLMRRIRARGEAHAQRDGRNAESSLIAHRETPELIGGVTSPVGQPSSRRAVSPSAQQARRRVGRRMVAAAILAISAVAISKWPSGRPSAPAHAHRVAVFPFAVNARPDLVYFGEASMDYVSSAIDGLGELQPVDPLSLVARLRRDGPASQRIGPERARIISSAVNAGRFVLGTIHEVGGKIRISAALYDVRAGQGPVASASAEGSPQDLSVVTGALTRDLFADQPIGRGARLTSMGSIRALSHGAEHAYLKGEAYLRRAQYDSAAEAFRRAVRDDSTFALAWYRLGYAEEFRGPPGAEMIPSLDAAMRHLDRLSERDQLLAKAYHAYAHGDPKLTEQWALKVVSRYPDQVEGLWLLGVNRLAKSWMYGRRAGDAREPLVRALAIDPSHPLALYQMIWLSAYERRYAELDSLVRASGLRAHDHRITHGPFAHVVLAFAGDDTVAQQGWLERVRTDPFGLHLGLTVAYYTDNMSGGRGMLRSLSESATTTEADRKDARWELGHFEYGAGRRRAAMSEFRRASSAAGERLIDYVLLSVLPIIGLPTAELRSLRDSVQSWVPSLPGDGPNERGGYLRGYWPGEGEYFTGTGPREAMLLRPYLLGLLSARVGDADIAERYAVELETAGQASDSANLWSDLALEIRALIDEQAGRLNAALSTLERARMTTRSHYQFLRVLYRRPIGRFLRAELLFRLGRYEEAIAAYEPATVGKVLTLALLAPSTLRIAQSYERLGQRRKAVEYYSRFVARWSECDPELQALLDDARQRLAHLKR